MSISAVETERAPAAIGPYSQAVKAGDYLYCSGQIPLLGQSGELIAGGIKEQTRQVMENLGRVLEAAGSGFDGVVKTTIYLTKIGDFPQVNDIYGAFFKAVPPARATVQVAGLPKGALVEVEAVAYLGS